MLGQYRNSPITEFLMPEIGHQNHLPYAEQMHNAPGYGEIGFSGPSMPQALPTHFPIHVQMAGKCASCEAEQSEYE